MTCTLTTDHASPSYTKVSALLDTGADVTVIAHRDRPPTWPLVWNTTGAAIVLLGDSFIRLMLRHVPLLRLALTVRATVSLVITGPIPEGFEPFGFGKRTLPTLAALEITEINKLTAQVIQTPLKIIRKAEKSELDIEAIEEEGEGEPPLLPPATKPHNSQCLPELDAENINPRTGKVKASTKKAPVSRSRRAPSARVKRMSKRSSRTNFVTPAAGRVVDLCAPGGTSVVTTKFDSRVFKTPGLRIPAVNERVYTISANGSPLADSNDIFITVPVGGGESIRLTASDLTKKNLLHLNPEAQGIMKKLSVRLAQACSGAKTYR
ncbi:PREDICTED: borealin [Charadrius vociferus]|uniref:borealin n=1 Tax=Charadrius vociferus TaxID=50402 RepID=UPI0005216C23|nr:PREDICTED: borealin [Charadrius vociferus]